MAKYNIKPESFKEAKEAIEWAKRQGLSQSTINEIPKMAGVIDPADINNLLNS